MIETIELTVNGERRTVRTDHRRTLLEVLREDLELTGTKYGCGEGQCRACTVILGGEAVQSCLTPIRSAKGKSVRTIEGLARGKELHPIQQAFLDEDAMQCGFCVAGGCWPISLRTGRKRSSGSSTTMASRWP